ncbi:hypothetical protein A6F68_00689 [Tsuneonella dongtanensis]|uniref:HNH nuclease domain-containing protein n=1 Tax=Tsuneonella dongtanensis TaxID=692370 RepID=A0A1B2AAV8_9SPHN|nr:hypothetical protein A6F68_00689 [Tsuneonella dongtanensis]
MPDPPKRANKRRSLEHLTPRSLGGDDSEANLVVCHQHCNAHLKDRPREQKEKMRTKWHRAFKKGPPLTPPAGGRGTWLRRFFLSRLREGPGVGK